jgi:NAD+ diphosphatase
MSLDRVSSERKDPRWIAQRLGDPAARTIAATADAVLVDAEAPTRLRRVPAVPDVPEEAILLGLDGATPLFALDLEGGAPAPDGGVLVPLREAGPELDHAEGGLAACVVALLGWHRAHPHCAVCGARTEVVEVGYARRCPHCGAHHFPRTDPAVIMLVERGDEILLGRRPGWPAGRYSVLAGFVSPGESLEEAVIREVREESGIECRDPRFVASQPWPFPSSLMLGFVATGARGRPSTLDGELEDVGWFSLDAVAAALDGDHQTLQPPPAVSIAHLLIARWVAERRAAAS